MHNAVMFMKKQNTVFFARIAEKQGSEPTRNESIFRNWGIRKERRRENEQYGIFGNAATAVRRTTPSAMAETVTENIAAD